MKLLLKQSADSIIDRQFDGNKVGYDALQVDNFLDEIASDYVAMEQFAIKKEKAIEELKNEIAHLKEKNSVLEADNAILNEKMKDVPEGVEISLANIDLLKRISALEQALYKLGKDPSEIK